MSRKNWKIAENEEEVLYMKQCKQSCKKCGKYGYKSVNCPEDDESIGTKKRIMRFWESIVGIVAFKAKKLKNAWYWGMKCWPKNWKAQNAANINGDDEVELAF